MSSIYDLRREFESEPLSEKEVSASPFELFNTWMESAVDSGISDPNAFVLSTVREDGQPSSRVVLLRGYDEQGFTFFTNYNSQKGQELLKNPKAAINIFWKEFNRQIRIQGTIEKTSPQESDKYFNSRPTNNRLASIASPQSQILESREELEGFFEKVKVDQDRIERPFHWGGYRLVPNRIEFWQGRPSRMHDRVNYFLQENGIWKIERLAP